MSSYYTTISCDEWKRMQDSIASAEAYVIRSNEEIARLKELDNLRRKELNRVQQENGRMIERALDVLATSYRAAVAEVEEQVHDHVVVQAEEFGSQLSDLRNQATKLGTRIEVASGKVDELVKDYNEVFSKVMKGLPQEKAKASKILSELDKLLEKIRLLYPENFAATEYASLEAIRTTLAANIEAEDFQAAIFLSQDSVIKASRVLTQLILKNEQYNAQISELQDRVASIQARAEWMSSPNGGLTFELGEETAEYDYDINFWSAGRFEKIVASVGELAQQLKNAQAQPVSQGVLDALTEQVTQLDSDLAACDKAARQELAGAIAVENTAQRLYGCLEERGWELQESGRQDEDSRKPYAMTYEDGSGNTVSIVVASGEQPERPAFFYEAFADSEGLAAIVKAGVGAALQDEGLIPGEIVHRDDCAGNTSPDAFINQVFQERTQMLVQKERYTQQDMRS